MITWMQPQWAWAGLSILVPLLIHLWNKKVRKKKKVGFVGLYISADQSKSSRIQWQDILLMLLRMLILALLTVYLMQPIFQQSPTKINKVYLIDPLLESQWIENLDSVRATQQAYWLQIEVLPFSKPKPVLDEQLPNYWKTLKAWSRQGIQIDTVVLFTHGQQKYFPTSELLAFPFYIDWRLIPSTSANRYLISRITRGDSLYWKIGYWEEEQWKVKDSISLGMNSLSSSLKTVPHSVFAPDTVHVQIFAKQSRNKEEEFLRDALSVAADFSFKKVVFTETDTADWLFVLSESDPLPSHRFRVVYQPQESARAWFQIQSDALGKYWRLQKSLVARSTPTSNEWLLLAEELLRALNWDEESRIIRQEADDRQMAPETLDMRVLHATPPISRDFQWVLLGFLLFLLAIERIYAYYKRV
ncbi:BatA domain-containing protein [Cytophagales bacterium LB-30]|uniref:BatA domain-containing protein n=1 Tax=Shiella aurantiaca TaxID=3058365 RepID=A0ABT8F1A2_9BACT|nr:BatA domain-containing protein [Shiella aurantiaca]MDN4164019.1 BatA domain-containing protein [Shiella aurantiaca]